MSKENLLQAAGRHIQDAQILITHQRYDNAVYISAYSVECILKLFVNYYTENDLAKSYNHNLLQLNEATTSKLLIIFPHISNLAEVTQTQLQQLSNGHPERRYWANYYLSAEEAQQCFITAKNLYEHTVSNLILDGHYLLSEV